MALNKQVTKFEVSHVTTVEDDIRVFLLRESQHWCTDIQALNRIVSFQVSDVATSSAGDIEQIVTGGPFVFLDYLVELCCFLLVVLERVNSVVEFG